MKAIEVGAVSSPSVRRLLDVTAPSETEVKDQAPTQEAPLKQELPKKK